MQKKKKNIYYSHPPERTLNLFRLTSTRRQLGSSLPPASRGSPPLPAPPVTISALTNASPHHHRRPSPPPRHNQMGGHGGDEYRDFFSQPDPVSLSAGFDVFSQPAPGASSVHAPRSGMEGLDMNSQADCFPDLASYEQLLQSGPTAGQGLPPLRIRGGRDSVAAKNPFRAPRSEGEGSGSQGGRGGRGAGGGQGGRGSRGGRGACGGSTGAAPSTDRHAVDNFMTMEDEGDGQDEDHGVLQVDGTSLVSKFSI